MTALTVLILDDQPITLNMVSLILKKNNVTDIYCCHQATQALDIIKNNHIDLVLSDLIMPNMDGIEFINNLSRLDYQGQIAIMSSAKSDIVSVANHLCKLLHIKTDYVVKKPISQQQIEDIIFDMRAKNQKKIDSDTLLPSLTIKDLLFGLENRQISTYYQPQVSFDNREIIGVEALARWNHPEHGLIYPNIFIPMIEAHHLEKELFDVVLDQILRDISLGLIPYNVSVNLTQIDLEDPDFTDKLIKICKFYNVEHSKLTLELSEHGIYSDSVDLVTNISRLRLNNFGISIDDFGIGKTSYFQLSKIPVTEIKIDRSFISDCFNDETSKSIVKSICMLSKELNVKLVAEGVEDEVTWNLLKDYGVDICQGYFTGKPMPLEKIQEISY
ncbi:EAL domain-containing response regulator [Vibrio sp. AK197]